MRHAEEKLSTESFVDAVHSIRHWQHRIKIGLGNLQFTPGHLGLNPRVVACLPENMGGLSLLDTGAYDGLYSFWAWGKGAEVTATDIWNSSFEEFPSLREGNRALNLVKDFFSAEMQVENKSVYEIESLDRQFDIVLCLGLLYVLESPLLALRQLAQVTRHQLIIETEQIREFWRSARSLSQFINTDARFTRADYWCFNRSCLKEMLLAVGFKRVEFKELLGRSDLRKIDYDLITKDDIQVVTLREDTRLLLYRDGNFAESEYTLPRGMSTSSLGRLEVDGKRYHRVCLIVSRREGLGVQGYVEESKTGGARLPKTNRIMELLPSPHLRSVVADSVNYYRGRRVVLSAFK